VGGCVPSQHYVCTFEEAVELIEACPRFWVSNCGCREQKGECKRSRVDVCLQFAEATGADGSGIREIGRDEVDEILREAREKHLVARPFRDSGGAVEGICFCCDDCCGYFLDPTERCDKGRMVERTDLEFDGATYRCVDPAACRPVELAALPTEGRTARAGAAMAGLLGAGDPLIVEGRSGRAWALEGRAGESYTIELRSTDFDAYLYFVGPGLAEPLFDDDGAGEGNSRLAVRLPQTGTYRVIVSAYNPGGQGAYELQVQANGR